MSEPAYRFIELNGRTLCEVESDGEAVSTVQDAVDLVGNASFQDAVGVVLEGRQLAPAFFDLRSGFAGEVLQKFTNYRLKLAVVGGHEDVASEAFQALVHESNTGSQVRFLPDKDAAYRWLTEGPAT